MVHQKIHLDILCKALLSQKVQDRFGQNFGPPGYLQSFLALFAKNCFPAIFGSHLEILFK